VCYLSVTWFNHAYCCVVLDELFSPDFNTDIDSGSTGAVVGTYLGMPVDLDISDSEMDRHAMPSEAGPSLDQDPDSDSEPEDDDDGSDLHPIMEPLYPSTGNPDISGPGPLPERDRDTGVSLDTDRLEAFAADAADLPDVVKRLRKQLLSSYTQPIYPPIDDPRECSLTPAEQLSLKHYVGWVDSRGTVKAYAIHAKILQEATGLEILSLYMARKLAIERTGLSSQLVDMCPKSCMAFTGEFKNLRSCNYIRDKRKGPCGELRYDKKDHPRAQMLYTPIAPVIQSYYKNKKMAEDMRYRHKHLQKALKKLDPNSNSPPAEYSDFSGSISHINHFQDLNLFQDETDTAITISGDGAQLTMKKQSDVWVLVVTILNLPPDMRSRAANIIIPLVIPGPSSPGNVESFIYVLYEELAKLSVGVWTYDALSEQYFLLKVYLCGVLGDMLGSAKLSRMAGHMAVHGCRFSMVEGARPSKDRGMVHHYTIVSFYLIILPCRC
jgi:Transposase family tnp2